MQWKEIPSGLYQEASSDRKKGMFMQSQLSKHQRKGPALRNLDFLWM
jgi:hypothetical protein